MSHLATPLVAEFTDGTTTITMPVTEEVVLGGSWCFPTPNGDDQWHRIAHVERLRGREDGAALRVHLVFFP